MRAIAGTIAAPVVRSSSETRLYDPSSTAFTAGFFTSLLVARSRFTSAVSSQMSTSAPSWARVVAPVSFIAVVATCPNTRIASRARSLFPVATACSYSTFCRAIFPTASRSFASDAASFAGSAPPFISAFINSWLSPARVSTHALRN